ncbi:PhzF family phenazine biosynthesis protein [Catalinimonas sp. 4WD22]|uniref:PhzF family phenazine biosynthesis protein n=1 Tax=Catalinimonas locisalis TaxID=3133978 RepID=UPI003100F47A
MKKYPIYQVDAFASGLFRGNPAAVVLLDQWPEDELMQRIAAENNLAETAFLLPEQQHYLIRWFTPFYEINLCGHATLASAWVIRNMLGDTREEILFYSSMSGELRAQVGDMVTIDLPAWSSQRIEVPESLAALPGLNIREAYLSRDLLLIVDSEREVRNFKAPKTPFTEIDCLGINLSAPGHDCDFVSRVFDARYDWLEDPVTGSAHCTMVPYWAKRLGKNQLLAHQVSEREGVLHCELKEKRVLLSGSCHLYLEGEIYVPQ